MTVLLEDGPGGLENTHTFTPAVGTAVTMNVLLEESGGLLLPRIKFDEMPGFRSLPDADDNRAPKTGRDGENIYRSLVRGKTFTVVGRLQAGDMAELRALERSMMAAFAERNWQGTWASVPLDAWANGEEAEAGNWETLGRVLQYEPDTSLKTSLSAVPSPYQLGFTLGIRQADARWFWSVPTTSDTDASSVLVDNRGIAPADPVITIVDPGSALEITNETTGKTLVFAFDSGLTGDLAIDFGARTAFLDGALTTDYTQYMTTASSDWWDADADGLRPGANTISQTGGTSLTVEFRHATY